MLALTLEVRQRDTTRDSAKHLNKHGVHIITRMCDTLHSGCHVLYNVSKTNYPRGMG